MRDLIFCLLIDLHVAKEKRLPYAKDVELVDVIEVLLYIFSYFASIKWVQYLYF